VFYVYLHIGTEGLIPQSLRLSGTRNFAIMDERHKPGNAGSRERVDQCVCAARAVEVHILVCLRSSCNHVT